MAGTVSTVDVNAFLTDGSGALGRYFTAEADRNAAREIFAQHRPSRGQVLSPADGGGCGKGREGKRPSMYDH